MSKELILITVFYIVPVILSIIVIFVKLDSVKVYDLFWIILISMLPFFNLFIGYLFGLVTFCKSTIINNFLNKKIK
jgi:hypothetical protein